MENEQNINKEKKIINATGMMQNIGPSVKAELFNKEPKHHYFFISIVAVVAILMGLALYIYIGVETEEIGNEKVVEINDQAIIKLIPDKDVYKIGDEVLLDIKLTTNKRTSGVDVILEFDPKFLELVEKPEKNISQNPDLSNLTADLSVAVFRNFPYSKLDKKGDKMVLSFSAITNAKETFKGGGSVAILKFKTLASGKTIIDIISDNKIKPDSNVAFEGKDILTEAVDATITIVK